LLRDASSRNIPPRRSEWGSNLPPDCFVSRGSISRVCFVTKVFLRRGVVSTSPKPQPGGPPRVGCPRLLIQYIRSYPPNWMPFLRVYRVLVGKPEGRRPLGRPRSRWEDNIRMDLRELGCGCVDWMELAQDRDRWPALVSAVMNIRVP